LLPTLRVCPFRADTISLVSFVGPLTARFAGTASFTHDRRAGRYDMAFSFDFLELSLFGRSVAKRAVAPKPKVYSFFLLQGDVAAANSSGTGGQVLMHRVDEE
jgi:hypothetical protein